jgi:hypothetical protein
VNYALIENFMHNIASTDRGMSVSGNLCSRKGEAHDLIMLVKGHHFIVGLLEVESGLGFRV